MSGEKVLLADVPEPHLGQLKGCLEGAGFDVAAFPDGAQALVVAQRERFGVALIGVSAWSMPGDGLDLARELRDADPALRIIFILDRFPLEEALKTLSRGIGIGIEDCIPKPAVPERVLESVRRALACPRKRGRPTAAAGGGVLLLERHAPSLAVLSEGLRDAGLPVSAVSDGEQALGYMERERFSVAVIGLPFAYADMTSLDLARKLRGEDPDLWIILMLDRFPLMKAFNALARAVEIDIDDCLLKPVEPARLLEAVQRGLGRLTPQSCGGAAQEPVGWGGRIGKMLRSWWVRLRASGMG